MYETIPNVNCSQYVTFVWLCGQSGSADLFSCHALLHRCGAGWEGRSGKKVEVVIVSREVWACEAFYNVVKVCMRRGSAKHSPK